MKALPQKKYFKLFFLPKLLRSTRKIEIRKLGISPRTVKVYDENDLFCLPKIKGRTTSWPKYMKLIENQATERHKVVLK